MPKKNIPPKEKSKCFTDKSNNFTFSGKESETHDDEYISVVDFEANKYKKRLIQSNWSKYEDNLIDFVKSDESIEIPKTNDFNDLLKTASSDCSHFQFNAEKLWKNEVSSISPSNIFNLDLNILASGLACVPFYERIGLDESYLSIEDKQRLDAAAEMNLKDYSLLREKLLKKGEDEPKVKSNESLKTLDESLKVKLDLNVDSEEVKETDMSEDKELAKTDDNVEKVEMVEDNKSSDKEEKNQSKIFFSGSDKDEDLEMWLDNMLDD